MISEGPDVDGRDPEDPEDPDAVNAVCDWTEAVSQADAVGRLGAEPAVRWWLGRHDSLGWPV